MVIAPIVLSLMMLMLVSGNVAAGQLADGSSTEAPQDQVAQKIDSQQSEVRVSFLVSPDGKSLAYGIPSFDERGDLATQLMICNVDGSEPRKLQAVPGLCNEVLWLGNDRLACTARDWTYYWIAPIDGSAYSELKMPAACNILYKRLSPNGRLVAFINSYQHPDDGLQYGLFVVELKTGNVRRLLETNVRTAPAWSPDSRKLAIGNAAGYVSYHRLVIVDVESGELTDMGVKGVGAAWSPDGRWLAFTTDVANEGGYWRGIPWGGRIGVLNVETRKLTYASPPAINKRDAATDTSEAEGFFGPYWSFSEKGRLIFHRGHMQKSPESGRVDDKEIWLWRSELAEQGDRAARKIVGDFQLDSLPPPPMAWGREGQFAYILQDKRIDRVDVETRGVSMVTTREAVQLPTPIASDVLTFNKPGVTVKTTRIDKAYGEAFANILVEARKEYERSFGLSLPAMLVLEAERDPQGSARLWTDGDSRIFLTISEHRQLAPSPKSGIFHIYGMCHELGHIVMYQDMRNLVGLPDDVGEGWAHYAGSVVLDEVAARLGEDIWPEAFDVAGIEGSARLKRQVEGKDWTNLNPTTRAAKVFYELEKKHGRELLGQALNKALAKKPSGKELMPLLVESVRELTGDPQAGDWIPQSVMEPSIRWEVGERKVEDNFFDELKSITTNRGTLLYYDDDTADGKQSMAGSGHAVLFRAPEGKRKLLGIEVFGSRYGGFMPPLENFTVFICDEDFTPLHEFNRPYGLFKRGAARWVQVPLDPVTLPERFYVCISFNPTASKGVFVHYDDSVTRSHSRTALPFSHMMDVKEKYDWMMRVRLDDNS
jgi:hypothetical protein